MTPTNYRAIKQRTSRLSLLPYQGPEIKGAFQGAWLVVNQDRNSLEGPPCELSLFTMITETK